jgi:hypothetical protein
VFGHFSSSQTLQGDLHRPVLDRLAHPRLRRRPLLQRVLDLHGPLDRLHHLGLLLGSGDQLGLPIESLIEKKLNLKTKKDILDLGIDTFNTAARNAVMEFAHDWEKYVERIGRWVDFKNSYKTMDNSFIEAVWWGIKEIVGDAADSDGGIVDSS